MIVTVGALLRKRMRTRAACCVLIARNQNLDYLQWCFALLSILHCALVEVIVITPAYGKEALARGLSIPSAHITPRRTSELETHLLFQIFTLATNLHNNSLHFAVVVTVKKRPIIRHREMNPSLPKFYQVKTDQRKATSNAMEESTPHDPCMTRKLRSA